jgi:hypothetical protein
MPRFEDRNVAEQNASYRRGVVLGLTMAEVGILIIFVLLLLIGFNHWLEAVRLQETKETVPVNRERLDALQAKEEQLQAVTNALDLHPTASEEEISVMVRSVVERAETEEGRSALQDVREAIASMERLKRELQAAGHPADLVEQVAGQRFTIANQEGLLQAYEMKLRNVGMGGTGERPCWVHPDTGTIEYLLDVVLSSDGIRMRENPFPHRGEERNTLPMPVTDPEEILSPAEFSTRTFPLYKNSLAKNCRFFVTVYDATGATEKVLYKTLLRTVEGHFYKRLAFEAAPF